MMGINDVPLDVLAEHVLSRLPFDVICACVNSGGTLSAAALVLLKKVARVRTLQDLKFRARAVDGGHGMSQSHFVSMLSSMLALQHVVCDSTVVAGHALANLIHAMREVEALLGRQVQQRRVCAAPVLHAHVAVPAAAAALCLALTVL